MSIKPIDYINIISKSQEVSKIKHFEDEKVNVQFEQGIVQQQKNIQTNLNKVLKSNESEYKIIDRYSNEKKGKNRSKDEKKSKNKKKAKKYNTGIGEEIDIKI